MKYTKFIIKNYKGIPNVEMDLSKKPSSNIFTLVGLNESGKTSLLEAIYLFQNDILQNDAHTLIPKSQQHSFTGTVSITAEMELSDDDLKEITEYLKNEHSFYLKNPQKIISIAKKYNFKSSVPDENGWKKISWDSKLEGKIKRGKKVQKLSQWNKDVWKECINLIKDKNLPKILYYPNFLFKFPEKIYLKENEEESKEQKEYRKILQDILSSIDDTLTVEEHLLDRIEDKIEKGKKRSLDALLLKMSAKLNKEILQQWDAVFKGTQRKEVVMSVETEDNGKHFIEVKIKQGSDNYLINDRSLGFRWFFSFLIFTAFRKSRADDPGETLFLLDEPASNLHQTSQKKLLDSLEKIVSNCKLIYSTHSHHLINPKWLSGTYIVKNKAINYDTPEESVTAETNISATLYKNFVAKYPKEDDHFKPVLDALEYQPSHLELIPPIVFTEGKNDYYTFKYMANIFFNKEYKLNFYPGAGVGKYERLFRLYLAWNKLFIALFDSDKAGEDARKKYIEEIDHDLENKISTFANIDSKWQEWTTEKLFSEKEKIEIIKSYFEDYTGGYDKSKFNTAIQNLYIKKKKFNFNQTTLNNFKKIFDFMANKLKK